MKKLLLVAVITALSATCLNAQQKWYFAAGVNGNISAVNQYSYKEWTVGAGVGIHRMLGEKFSVGLNVVYTGQGNHSKVSEGMLTLSGGDHVNAIGGELSAAYFGKIADWFYYVPELAVGMAHIVDESFVSDVMGRNTLLAGVSLLGLEFRPKESIGLRISAVNLSYNHNKEVNAVDFSLNPSLTVCMRF